MTTSTKPIVKRPVDGNIFLVVGACNSVLKKAGMGDKSKELSDRVIKAGSYDQALSICMEYVEFDLGNNDDDDDA